MRHIIRDLIEADLPSNWGESVEQANTLVNDVVTRAATKADTKGLQSDAKAKFIHRCRSRAISSQASNTWQRLNSIFSNHSHQKCYYCEGKEARSDKAIDHFRPKNGVFEDPTHPGYFWKAFEWQNYRYACTYCNSRRTKTTSTPGGKRTHFPILNQADRSTCETEDCERENPTLLDPFVREDTKLLTFLSNGRPAPNSSDQDSNEYLRAHTSIEVYHLDEVSINRERSALEKLIKKLVKKIDENPPGNEDLKEEILKRMRPEAPYSSAARIYFRQFRSLSRPWVLDLLEDL